ncbi:hypothetical protein PCYB_003100 [Plasmodium cynomolgi strain B]|uniref:Uncharacterized protein n=1 Tax=Plasmodium cynomolgi (strain B) TaxID=1120755 RepID=K6UF65_PLACD|nr:hypothetical protein PCYB_003100 [Plasmodium cynomolgi strain B]GAB69561.1 hypothetical protein PCYB_003100 [Plasmodium cynomolgi strain B]
MPVISFSTFRRDVTTNVGIGCLNVKDDIEVELSHKISKLDSSNGTEDIRQKCEEINKFLNEQKNVYNVCYEHRYKESLWYTPIIIKKILSESTEYNKCPQKWTLEPEEATKLTVKEEESHDENEKQTKVQIQLLILELIKKQIILMYLLLSRHSPQIILLHMILKLQKKILINIIL